MDNLKKFGKNSHNNVFLSPTNKTTAKAQLQNSYQKIQKKFSK